ncbi:hypothetical protein HQ865_11540 [Mucilaginibacter mali]|uniref:Imm33-like domain-containing protein n=1 Tax=Mucilaginibacter mali TaxID=2740462 RepID=A0A7D4QB32_9SPHI|nr:hypothetical protein [Mucilaginibacter mali]QKJ30364.1 hypothetical protein HQ865_11540 [Mucilaginibacter mali]
MDWINEQRLLCQRYGSIYTESPEYMKIGISLNVKDGIYPIHGLRHPIERDTTGWYIWAGEYSEDPEFFVSLHVIHLNEWCPEVAKFLGLSPGWRFLSAPNYEDVWEDLSLLDI